MKKPSNWPRWPNEKPRVPVQLDQNDPLYGRVLHWWTGLNRRANAVRDLAGGLDMQFVDGASQSPTWKDGEFTTSDAQNGPYARTPVVPFPVESGGITYSCWFKTSRNWLIGSYDYHGLIYFGSVNNDGLQSAGLHVLEAATNVRFITRARSHTNSGWNFAQYNITDLTQWANEWVHFVGVHFNWDVIPKLYINGEELTPDTTYNVATGYPKTSDRWKLGRCSEEPAWTGCHGFPGSLRNAMVIKGPATTKEIIRLYKDQYGALKEGADSGYINPGDERLFHLRSPSIIPILGKTTVTYTRSSVATLIDHEGLFKTALAGEARFAQARRVHNLANGASDNFDDWVVQSGCTIEGFTSTLAPTDAKHILFGHTFYFPSASAQARTANLVDFGRRIRFSVWARALQSTSASFKFRVYGTAQGTTSSEVIAVTSQWKRYTALIDQTGEESQYAYLAGGSDDPEYIEFSGFMVENVTGQTNENPSEYISVGAPTSRINLVPDPTFQNGCGSTWACGSGATMENGLVHFPQSSATISQYTGKDFTNNGWYFVRVTVAEYNGYGSLIASVGTFADTNITMVSATGVYAGLCLADGGHDYFKLKATVGTADYKISHVECYEADFLKMLGSGVDAVRYFDRLNGNTIADGTQGESELVSNSGFDSDLTDWYDGVNVTSTWLAGGYVKVEPAEFNRGIYHDVTAPAGTYKISVRLADKVVGNARVTIYDTLPFSDSILNEVISSEGVWSFTFTTTSANFRIYLNSSGEGGSNVQVWDWCSVKPYTAAGDTNEVIEARGADLNPLPRYMDEAAATNLVTTPRMSSGSMAATNVTIADSTAWTTPFGDKTTIRLNATTDLLTHYAHRSGTILIDYVSGTVYSFSAIVKNDGQDFVQLVGASAAFGANNWVTFDLTDGTIGSKGTSNISESITALANGWWLLTLTATATATASGLEPVLGLVGAKNATRLGHYAGVITDYVHWASVQCEVGLAPTSYFDTSRSNDALAYDRPWCFHEHHGTLIFEGWVPGASYDDYSSDPVESMVAVRNNSASLLYHQGIAGRIQTYDGSAGGYETPNFQKGNEYNCAVRWNDYLEEMQVGFRDVTGAGAWSWRTAVTFDKRYAVDDFIHIFYGTTIPEQVRNIIIYAIDKGTAWVEANY